MTAVEDFQTSVVFLEGAVNLGYWFVLELFKMRSFLVPDDGTDKTTLQTRVSTSTLLTSEEQTECLALIDDAEVFNQREGRDVVPMYYMSVQRIVRQITLLMSAYYENSVDHPNIEEIYNTFVASNDYLLADEDEYKIPALLFEKVKAAEAELVTEIDEVNAAE